MKNRFIPGAAGVFTLVKMLALVHSCCAGEISEQDFRKNVKKPWKELEAFYSQLECEWKTTANQNYEVKRKKDGEYHVLINKDWVCLTVKRDRLGVMAVNSRYSFLIRRPSDDLPFQIVNYGDTSEAKFEGEEFRGFAQAACYCGGKTLSQWLTDTHVSTKRISQTKKDNKVLVEWEARYEPGAARGPSYDTPFTMRLLLDPDAYWNVQSYEMIFDEWKRISTIEYGETDNAFPTIQHVQVATSNKDGRHQIINADVHKFVSKSFPEEEFTLTAFGLPELDVAKTSGPRYWAFIILGVLVDVIAITIIWRGFAKKLPA